MSTKTSIKRIALVAVAALGFGMVSTVTANAANTTVPITIANTTAEKSVSCRVAVSCSITVKGTWTGVTAANVYASGIAAAFTSQPSGASVVYPTVTASDTGWSGVTADNLFSTTADATVTTTYNAGSASQTALAYVVTSNSGDDVGAGSSSSMATVTFVPSAVGTYSLSVWNEDTFGATASSALSGSESYGVFTITVSAGVASITTTVHNSTAAKSAAADSADAAFGSWGSLVKVTIKDSNGTAAALANGEICSVDPSGTGDVAAVNGSTVTSSEGAAYNLAPGDFTNGVAYLNIADATAETVTVAYSCGSVSGTSTHVFKAYDNTDGDWEVNPTADSTGWAVNADPTITVPSVSSVSYTLVGLDDTNFTATEYGAVRVYDADGSITGKAAMAYDLAIINDGSFTIAVTELTAGGALYELTNLPTDSDAAAGSQTLVATTASRNLAAAGVTASPASPRIATGGSIAIDVTVKDQFGVAYANGRVTLALGGRNATQATQSGTTNASGKVSFTVTDTAASTSTLTTDTVTITAYDEDSNASPSSAPVITWSNVSVATVTLTAEDEDSTVAGTVSTDISAAAAGATGSSSAPYATVKDANGNVLAGVPVVFTISGLTGAEVHSTKVTVYTGADGVATTAISSYAAGKVTVTATAGGKSDTDSVYFKQQTATEARTIAAVATENGVKATVTDRYGNAIEGVTVNATRDSGTGFFANGSSSTSGTTDKNGVVEFKFDGAASVKVAFTAADYGQSADAAGYVSTTAVTASAAGTTTANQTGLGASLAPAGVNSVIVEVAATTGATDAVDAANEATDAANAATDAANAAAEAADAATAAAQDAQAAVAALATEVAAMISGIKAQITSLTNLIIKIKNKVKA